MSSKLSAFAPSLVNDPMGETCNDSNATSSVRRLTPEEEHEYGALEEERRYNFGYCRQTLDLINWLDTQLASQSTLVRDEDMPKYNELRQQAEKMTAEARECFGPDYEYGSLAEERVGKLGEENPFTIWFHKTLGDLTAIKALVTGWKNPWGKENDEREIYLDHLAAQRKKWAAVDALESTAGSEAKGSCESKPEGGQDRGSSQSTNSNKDPSQNPLVGSFVKRKPAPARPGAKSLSLVSWCNAQNAISTNKLYILKCQKQSKATTKETNKSNFTMTANRLTDYNEQLERLYPPKEPADEDGSLERFREETAEKYSQWVRKAEVLCPSVQDQCTTKIQGEDDSPSDLGV